jgi:uncharacterized protein with HEPN domain
MRSNRERLLDILEAIDKIDRFAGMSCERFESDEMLQIWIIHHLQIIGEAASRLTQQFLDEHPEVQWNKIIGMRHILVHGYFEIDYEIVWQTVINDLPKLKAQIQRLIEKTKDD